MGEILVEPDYFLPRPAKNECLSDLEKNGEKKDSYSQIINLTTILLKFWLFASIFLIGRDCFSFLVVCWFSPQLKNWVFHRFIFPFSQPNTYKEKLNLYYFSTFFSDSHNFLYLYLSSPTNQSVSEFNTTQHQLITKIPIVSICENQLHVSKNLAPFSTQGQTHVFSF